MALMKTQRTTHERHILASDRALMEAARLVSARVPIQKWPVYLRAAVSMALDQACDDTRLAKNRISAHRANDLLRLLSRRGVVSPTSLFGDSGEQEASFEDSEYVMDRLLADLVTKVSGLSYGQRDKVDARS